MSPGLRLIGLLLAALAFPAHAGTAYWLWAGIPAPADAAKAEALYLHQGHVHVESDGRARLVNLGMAPHPAPWRSVYLVYRLGGLPAAQQLADSATSRARSWERAGVHVAGVQLDFDAASLRLPAYAAFLREFRAALPQRYRLSITGLADWSNSAPAGDLDQVGDAVDEIAFQLYRGREAVPGWQAHAASLSKLRKPFRLGLLRNMQLTPELAAALARNPHYRGPIYFLTRTPANDS